MKTILSNNNNNNNSSDGGSSSSSSIALAGCRIKVLGNTQAPGHGPTCPFPAPLKPFAMQTSLVNDGHYVSVQSCRWVHKSHEHETDACLGCVALPSSSSRSRRDASELGHC